MGRGGYSWTWAVVTVALVAGAVVAAVMGAPEIAKMLGVAATTNAVGPSRLDPRSEEDSNAK